MGTVNKERELVRASLDKQPHEVASMFDGVAKRYDLTNTLISGGQDRYWRWATRKALALRPGERVLDLAAGTGVSTLELSKSGAWCVAADFSQGMLAAGRFRGVPMVAGDAMALPFADESFDAVTISYGLRNVADPDLALREMLRVTKPGGRLVVAEFSTPTFAPFRTIYMEYLMKALPAVARKVSSNPDAYVYLAESIRAWPTQSQLALRIADAGWSQVKWRNLSGGAVALHRGYKLG
ncbi:demethylmenaquinone methyltransferase [Nocardia sp. SYP-A9097]|uniref:demethylmenaquinone methyltransferase n=1 Tax=Nocardia sp. SYP-A9097 TaxID=2663237 RepID=UPI00129A89CC|nr:demethylmenaquinone methyltransferase [Nocardia sp. SYP-A9097]MRH87084.1 demethylmenaquinone methyltransferase [Nocardia sp. SYP-A9097]